MKDFSDLPKIVLTLCRIMCIMLTWLILAIMAIIYWQRHYVEKIALNASEVNTQILMAVLALICLALAYAMKRELRKM